MPQATVYDVAERAGVSIATVSRVLNSPDKVQDATRARVQAAIDALGFVPRADATARARRTHGRIGVLAPFFTYPSFVQRLRGVAAALVDSPFELAIYNVDSSSRLVNIIASLPVTRRIDGLIVMALPFDEEAAQRLLANDLHTVLVEFSRPGLNSIRIDDHAGGAMAAEYLLSRGHRVFGFVGDADVPDYALPTSDYRLAGYRDVLASAGIHLEHACLGLAPHGLETARTAALRVLNQPGRPTAIFAASDTQAMGVLKAARELGLHVPGDLAVVGFDDLDIADYIGLTTIRQPLEESGRVAVDLLLSRIADPERPVQRVRLPLSLVRRETA